MSRRYEIHGSPTPEEEAAVIAALEQMMRREEEARRPSMWKIAGRAGAARSGILDARQSGTSAWKASGRIPWAGRAYNGRQGRGDAK